MPSPKTLDDLPQFFVSEVVNGQPDSEGRVEYKLYGTLEKVESVSRGGAWLLLPDRGCIPGEIESFDENLKSAIFITSEEDAVHLPGSKLPLLNGRWKPYHAWMVAEPKWIWTELKFESSDATAERVPANDVTLVEGRPVKEWLRIVKKGSKSPRERYYPLHDGGKANIPKVDPQGIVPGGWDHEHCELCNGHINPGDTACVDRSEHWVCNTCRTRYVLPHDLSFLMVDNE